MGFVCVVVIILPVLFLHLQKTKIALSFLFSYTLAFALPPACTTYIFTQIHLPDGVHSVVMQTAVLTQLAGEQGGKNKHQWVYEAGTDYFGTAAEINLVKLWHSVPWCY